MSWKLAKQKRLENRNLLREIKGGSCTICYKRGTPFNPIDPSHIRTRGSGGPDTHWNVVPMCREHHNEWGRLGWATFLERYPSFWWKLKNMGWECENGKLLHPMLLAREGF